MMRRRQHLGMMIEDLVIDRHGTAQRAFAAAFRRADAEQPDHVTDIAMGAQFGGGHATAMFGFGIVETVVADFLHVVAIDVLRHGFSHMGTDAPVHPAQILDTVFRNRKAAHQHHTAAEFQLVQQRVQHPGESVQREVRLRYFLLGQAFFLRNPQGGVQFLQVFRLEPPDPGLVRFHLVRIPGAGQVDSLRVFRARFRFCCRFRHSIFSPWCGTRILSACMTGNIVRQ